MKNLRIKIGIIGLILSSVISTLSAQEITTMQFMKGLPQSDLLNPALHNDSSKLVIGLPGLSGVNFDLNSGFALDDVIHKGTGSLADSLVLDIEKFHQSLSSTNTIQQQLSLPLFTIGIHRKNSYFSFVMSEKVVTKATFDKSLVTFLKDGNAPYMGQNFDLGNLGLDAFQYSEFAFGYSNELIKRKLTVGMKVKVLFGKSAIHTEKMNIKVETAADGSYLNLNSDMKINLSAPLTVEYDQDGYFSKMNSDNFKPADYLLQTGNKGIAFDLGAVYKLTPKITLSGSIIDIGKISFSKDLISLNHVSAYRFDGIDFSKSIDNSATDYISPSDLIESETNKLKDSFRPKKSEFGSDAFDMSIPTKIFLGGTYGINQHFNMGVLEHIYKNGDYSQNTLTLSANAMLGKIFSLTGSYSMIGNSYNNLGLGMALRLGTMQFYAVTDNVLAADPSKAKIVNVRFGLNLLYWHKD